MHVKELIGQVRDMYLEHFAVAVDEVRKRGDGVSTEAALRNAEGGVVSEGVLDLPMRIDVAVLQGGEVTDSFMIAAREMVTFEPITFAWNERLTVDLAPFGWDRLDVHVLDGVPDDWSPVTAWFWSWFKPTEDGTGEPLGVVHFLSDPEPADGTTILSADLGTAPVEAFDGLLDALVTAGVRRIGIRETEDEDGREEQDEDERNDEGVVPGGAGEESV